MKINEKRRNVRKVVDRLVKSRIENFMPSYIAYMTGTNVDEAETVGQYTNAVDCNKKKVFEGDLIQSKDGKNVIGVVEWYKSECRFVAKINIPNEEINCFEVIGNKWDNPELAEKILDFYNEYERNNK